MSQQSGWSDGSWSAKSPALRPVFSCLLRPNGGKIRALRFSLGQTSLLCLEDDLPRLAGGRPGSLKMTQAEKLHASFGAVIVVFISGWRAAYIPVKANKDLMEPRHIFHFIQVQLKFKFIFIHAPSVTVRMVSETVGLIPNKQQRQWKKQKKQKNF